MKATTAVVAVRVDPSTSRPVPTPRQVSESQYAGPRSPPRTNDGAPQPTRDTEPAETDEIVAYGRRDVTRSATSTPSPYGVAVAACRNAGDEIGLPEIGTNVPPSR